jgi:hypothetical protein
MPAPAYPHNNTSNDDGAYYNGRVTKLLDRKGKDLEKEELNLGKEKSSHLFATFLIGIDQSGSSDRQVRK